MSPMKLYLMRHGQSPGMLEAGVKRDFDRPLSERGRRDAREAAAYLNEHGVIPELVLASPLLRAQQTAQEVTTALSRPTPLKSYEPLSNQISGSELFIELGKETGLPGSVMLIGHLPQLPELTHHLTGVDISIAPAGLLALDVAEKGSKLLWTRVPDGV